MNRGITIVITAILAFCTLSAGAIVLTVPRVETKLRLTAQRSLEERNLAFARVDADGRDLVVTGEAPDLRRREEAISAVATTWGHRVVLDRMTVAPRQPPPPPTVIKSSETRLAEACQDRVDDLLSAEQVRFEPARTRLSSDSGGLLDLLADVLTDCPEATIEIEGHTDARGRDSTNLRISQRRARAVLKALGDRGIDERRMHAVGYGSSQPIASNDDPEGRARNRRIELRVLRKD